MKLHSSFRMRSVNKTIEFFHNGTSQGISDNIECNEDISYCLAVFMRGKDDSITVQDFEIVYPSQDFIQQHTPPTAS